MINKITTIFQCRTVFVSLLAMFFLMSASVTSAKTENIPIEPELQAYQLSYVEREPGTDDYEVTILVSDRYIRIDEKGENSGYIIYDDRDKVIYSVGHHDNSVLVIRPFEFSEEDSPVRAKIEYLLLDDAPEVSGKKIYNYRVYVETTGDENELTCMELQLVEDILPEVRAMLKRYQNVVSGQQVKMTDKVINDMQTACYFVDQIYNTGEYYDKGLPIQEWHSNERFKVLTSYKKVPVSAEKFTIPNDYRQFSIDTDTKTFIE
jgi:hypothetical protein